MVISGHTFHSQIRESYRIIVAIICLAVAIQLSSKIPIGFFESSVLASTAIVFLPLAVAASCFAVSRIYGGSRVFGKSYLVLGLSYVAFFAGEAFFYFYMEMRDDYSYSLVPDVAFMISMPLLLAHIIINIRYFAERLERYQKILLVAIPATAFAGYLLALGAGPPVALAGHLPSLILVAEAVIVLGFTIVAFTVFRQTALFGPWFLLLVGILLSTAGDILYHYTDIISSYDTADPATGLWLASSMVVIYALYRHQRSI